MMFAREAHVLVSKYFLCILQFFWVPRFFFGEEDLEYWWGDGVELLADQEIALFTWSQNWAVPVQSECLTIQLWPSISCNYLELLISTLSFFLMYKLLTIGL